MLEARHPLHNYFSFPTPPGLSTSPVATMVSLGDEETTKPAGYKFLNLWDKEKGGFRACSFIFALSSMENMGFIANMSSFVLYFIYVLHFDASGASNTVTNFLGSTFLLSVVGAIISDTYLSRFTTILIFGLLELVGLMLITIQAYYKNLQPVETCVKSCVKGGIAVMFYASLVMLALGSGGVRGALAPLGADQFNAKDPKEAKALARFFNWLTLSITLGATFGVTFIVYVSTTVHWYWGFFMALVSAFIGFAAFALGKPFFRVVAQGDSPFVRVTQVIVLAFKNRSLSLPENSDELYEIDDKEREFGEEKIHHTNQFRVLDKAAILQEGSKPEEWKVCTVTQVEEVKILTRMLPIIGSTIIMNTCLAQLQTFSVQQGFAMNRFLGSFEVPAPSIPVIPLVFMNILIPVYEFIFVPFARKFTHHPTGITQLQRVGIGLVLSAISMTIAGIVEIKRRNQSLNHYKISIFWLSFQYGIFGIADMFTLVGLLEFFYREAPAGMKSLSTSFTWISLSFGYFLSSIFVDIINSVTKRITPSKLGWLHGKLLDYNNLNLFYWFLAILSCLNFVNYLYWAKWYKYRTKDSDSSETKSQAPLMKESPPSLKEDDHGEKIIGTPNSPEKAEDDAKEKEEKVDEGNKTEDNAEDAKEKEEQADEAK